MNPAQHRLATAALTSFRLNGQFLTVAEDLARPAELTAARWQVLGAVLQAPDSVAGIARTMGMTRQGVQRLADLLVDQGLADYRPNPGHQRAKLIEITAAGRRAIAAIDPGHSDYAARLTRRVGAARLEEILAGMAELSAAVETLDEP